MNNPVVVIPIYQSRLSKNEQCSLLQCFKILGKYPIKFVCPNDLNIEFYEKLLNNKKYEFSFERFDDKHFENLNLYSHLLLNKDFYKRFINYEFMLVYQLDAWVFKDELEYWCNQNYDYIGAPWFEDYGKADENSPMLPFVGNGGFSLRKISSILKILETNYKKGKSFKEIYNLSSKRNKITKILNIPIYFARYIFQMANFVALWEVTDLYEDVCFSRYGKKAYKDFNPAPADIAMKFSFEVLPRRLYEMNNKQLPFGCHAFEKYDFGFWKQFITL